MRRKTRAGLSRKEFLRLGGASLAGAALLGAAGCGEEAGTGEGPVRLVFSHGPEPSGVLREQLDAFNRRHEGEIRVEWREMAADTGQYFNQLRTEFQAGASEIDVISGDVIWPAQFAANGWIEELSGRFPESERSRFLNAPVEANTWEGGVYGVPWFTDAGMLYYRKDLLQKSGFPEAPKTWGELKEMALETKREQGVEYGFVFQGAEYEGGVVDGLEYIWTHGGGVLDERSEKVVVDSPEAAAGLATERSMIEDGVAPISVVNYKEQETHQTFIRGASVFARNWPYMYGLIADPEQSNVDPAQVGVAPLPHAPGERSFSGLGGWNLFINAASQKKDAAWTLIEYLAAPEQQKQRALEGGYLPTLRELYEDREILDKVPVVRLGKGAILSARPRPVSPYYSDMSLRMAEQFNAALKGNVSPRRAVEILQRELENILERAG
ncbi:extracellular solute-binding protein, family 1 [Rubrobacter xylanophilus DSM 9941]|uniref:Extracellular solute-binding protein, family 1 n=1 Tax=Rubrobacter xylanophilus (strain DSM 9941 / JCM 11954 / NBRC 16129 / PRD-1) TaxID=266117 RepID=Q1AY89_RUBXD|nr:ABC transporter substrate-binding protein [Rubrobacter xylanophilus]ABG03639.1 extracellular solute-binding protein, family 1 [Rubrobacter xylanophilus DSM 9941]